MFKGERDIFKKYFDIMVSWIPNAQAVDLTRITIMDSGILPKSENAKNDWNQGWNHTNIVDLFEDEDYVHTQPRKKKTKRKVLDKKFKKNNEKLLLFLKMESHRRIMEAQASLELKI
jgi:hypothetical protein